VIVVVGSPLGTAIGPELVGAGGLSAGIAKAAAAAGASVQVVGRAGEDAAGDAVLLDLAHHAVGHVAVLRDAGRLTPLLPPEPTDDPLGEDAQPVSSSADPGPRLDAADIELALSYLPEYSVIVVAEPLAQEALRVVVDAAGWSGARLVVVGRVGDLATLPLDATVFEPPDAGDPDGAFASIVAAYSAGLDRGDDPRTAFTAAASAVASSPAD
jgi:NAD(P)-dependent dehydrogenase (short-subunit alcohol dehydrogenase family)